jgi:hypothetical protein
LAETLKNERKNKGADDRIAMAIADDDDATKKKDY